MDESGSNYTPSRIFTLTPDPRKGYRGHLEFPGFKTTRNSIATFKVDLNVRANSETALNATLYVENLTDESWVQIGEIHLAKSPRWSQLYFSIPTPYARFIDPVMGQLNLRIVTDPGSPSIPLDYISLDYTLKAQPTPAPTPRPTPIPTPVPNQSKLPWKSGFSAGSDLFQPTVDGIRGYSAWRGRKVDVAVAFIGAQNYDEAQGGSYEKCAAAPSISDHGAVAGMISAGVIPVLAIPVLTSHDTMKFDMVARGGIDKKHQAIADQVLRASQGKPIYLRIGWETDEGYPWSYTNHTDTGTLKATPASYIASWRRIARIYRDTLPKAKIVWNVLKNTREAVADYYPGDDLVDVLSIDDYDGYGGNCQNQANWEKYCLGSYNPNTGISKGIGGLLAFARSHHKKLAVDEWGAVNPTHTADNVGNNAFYVSAMFEFFKANHTDIEYESYYNRAGRGNHQIWPREDYNGKVSDAYLKKYHP